MPHRPSFVLRPMSAISLAAALSACIAAPSKVAAVPAAADTIAIAWEAEIRAIDPRFAVDANSQYLEHLLHCGLVKFDKDGQTTADLAKDWKWTTPTTLEMTLKPEAKFSDGTPVTAADVKATYDFYKKEGLKNPSPRKSAYAKVTAITAAKDGGKVTFTLAEPDSTFITNLAGGILPAKLAAKDMLTDQDVIVGCGPFTLKAINIGAVELEANARYTLGPAPKIKKVSIKIVKDETTRYAKLQAGEVDIVQNAIGRDKVTDIAKKNPALQVFRRPGQNTSYLGFNMKDPILSKVEVRQAITHAIDKAKIIKFVLNGLAAPATTLITEDDPFFRKDVPTLGYDVAKANELLDKAGLKRNGSAPRFKLAYKTTTDLTRIAIAKAIANDLKKVGIEVAVESVEWGKFKADVEAGKVQMWSLQWVGFKDPDIYRFAFASESFPPNGGNRGWYSNPELDKLLLAARAETDQKKRADLYEKVQRIVAQELPYVFLWHEENFAVVNKAVVDFEVYADGQYGSLVKAYKK